MRFSSTGTYVSAWIWTLWSNTESASCSREKAFVKSLMMFEVTCQKNLLNMIMFPGHKIMWIYYIYLKKSIIRNVKIIGTVLVCLHWNRTELIYYMSGQVKVGVVRQVEGTRRRRCQRVVDCQGTFDAKPICHSNISGARKALLAVRAVIR